MAVIDQLLEEWNELGPELHNLEALRKVYEEKLSELNSHQNSCIKSIAHQRYRMAKIRKNIKAIKAAAHAGDADAAKLLVKMEKNYAERLAQLAQVERSLPKENDTYLKIIIGNVKVSILNKEEQFRYKDEYEMFKLVLSFAIFFLTLVNIGYTGALLRPLELMYLFLIVWYYCMLTIRESILKVNGSRIKGWWRYHHFILTAAMGIMLVWNEQETWTAFRNQFMWFNGYISFVQYLQFHYQRGQLYRLKALGERDNMDITIEGFHSWMWRGLSFLLPFLFFGYCFQLYNAYTLYMLSKFPSATWHVSALSLLFLTLFIGNISTTLMIVPSKYNLKKFNSY